MPKEKTGSIRRRKDGKIYAVVTYTDKFGKRKFKEKLVKNESEANRQIRKMLNQIDDQGSDSLAPKKKTFRELAQKYKSEVAVAPVVRDGKTIRGLKSYKVVNYYVDLWTEIFGNLPLTKISLALIEEARNERLDELVEIEVNVKVPDETKGRKKWRIEKQTKTRTRKVSGVNREMATLRRMLNFAVQDLRWLNKNPFEESRGKKLINITDENQRSRILTRAEEVRLMRAVEQTTSRFLKLAIFYGLDAGTRKGEILKAAWKDINFDEGYLVVKAENAKTERERIVYLSERVLRELIKLKTEGKRVGPADKIIQITDFRKSWETVKRRAEIEDLTYHDLRHCHASQAIASGASLSEIRDQLGHSDIRTTGRYLNRNHESAKRYSERQNQRNLEIYDEIQRLETASEEDSVN